MEYLTNSNSKWVETGIKCERCDNDILREIFNTGVVTNHFTCKRIGCTWPSYHTNVKELLIMIEKVDYIKAQIIVKTYEEKLGLYKCSGSLPFSEYHEFHKWIEDNGWYELNEYEYGNLNEPDTRIDIKELYLTFKGL